MITDARELVPNRTIETDVCIVGAGAVGITLALGFADQPLQVCLIEAGGMKQRRRT